MTTQIEFFTDPELSDISKVRIYDSLQEQKDYFDSLMKVTVTGAFKGFDEPILIYEDIAAAIGHAYGRFKISDKYYYFYVVDVRQDTPGKSWLYYRLDHWETVREQFGITLGRGYVSRSSLVEPCATPYDPKYRKVTERYIFGRNGGSFGTMDLDIVFTARVHDSNMIRYGYMKGPFDVNEKEFLLSGKWTSYVRPYTGAPDTFQPSDIQGMWFSPSFINDLSPFIGRGWGYAETIDSHYQNKIILSQGASGLVPYANLGAPIFNKTDLINRASTNVSTSVICDLEGNVVYQIPYIRDNYPDNNIIATLIISMTSAKWKCKDSNGDVDFTIPCSGFDYFVDSEREYFARDREFDVQTRELNNNKDLISSVSGGAAGAASGAATGALIGSVGGPIGIAGGALIGAAAGGLGGLITGGSSFGVNAYFNPQEQAIKDRYYKKSIDPLSMVGGNTLLFMTEGSHYCGFATYEIDADTKSRIESDIANFGQYTTKAVASGESYLADDARLKGDFVIDGNVPENWKAAIQQRFSSGVHIIKRGS